MARLYLSQGTIFTRLPFQNRMVGVSTLNLQKKCILVAEKSCYLQEQSSKLFFSLREFLFSLIKLFFFFDLDCQNLAALGFDNHPDLKKEKFDRGKQKFSRRNETSLPRFVLSEQRFPATRNKYSIASPFVFCQSELFGGVQGHQDP